MLVNSWQDIAPYFTEEELFSPQTIHKGKHLIDLPALSLLMELREAAGALLCNHGNHRLRGVRSPAEQIALSGKNQNAAELSMHVTGKAFDLSSRNLTPQQIAEIAERTGFTGIGIYPTFCHCDRRTLFTPKPVIFRRD